jgi:hypothetical protein
MIHWVDAWLIDALLVVTHALVYVSVALYVQINWFGLETGTSLPP